MKNLFIYSLLQVDHGKDNVTKKMNRLGLLLGLLMIAMGAIVLLTDLFGVSAGWGFVIFIAMSTISFATLIFACLFCKKSTGGYENENNT